jgi:hypothetical protein
MKKINVFSSLILLGLVLLVFATSCKKTEVLMDTTPTNNNVVVTKSNLKSMKMGFMKNPVSYVVKNPEWELIEDSYMDEEGNTGKLFKNKNNPIEKLFETKSDNSDKFTGTFSKKYKDGILVAEICAGDPTDCSVNIQRDENGVITGVAITHYVDQ